MFIYRHQCAATWFLAVFSLIRCNLSKRPSERAGGLLMPFLARIHLIVRRHIAYLKYVLRHKWFVLVAGVQLGVPVWTLILHDWDKFLPDEWFPYASAFYKADGSKQYVESDAFTRAWNAHQKRNKHHWQWWMITWDRGTTECLPMSHAARLEMLADWYGAGRAIAGTQSPADWYMKNADKMQLHPETRAWVEQQLIRST